MGVVRETLRKFVCVAIMSAQCFAPVIAATPYDTSTNDESRLALVIGNSAYLSNPLDNPVNDANAMAKALENVGFEVVLANNLRGAELKRRVRMFQSRARAERGTALVYYAGHAVAPAGRNILLPIDINFKDILEVEDEGIDVAKMLAILEDSRKHTRIMIFDACRNNPYGQTAERLIKTTNRARNLPNALAVGRTAEITMSGGMAQVSAKGSVVAFSTAPDAVAEDGEGRTNSIFTAELVEALAIPGLTIQQVFSRVTERVRAETKGEQVPWVSGSLDREYVFNPLRAAPLQALSINAVPQPSESEKRRDSVEARLATEMANIKRLQAGERARVQLVVQAQNDVDRIDAERKKSEQQIAQANEARNRAEADARRLKEETDRRATQAATEKAVLETVAAKLAAERVAAALVTKQRIEELDKQRQVAEAQKAREHALAESRRQAELEAVRLAEVKRVEDARIKLDQEQREQLAKLALEREQANRMAAAEALRLKRLAAEQATLEKRELDALAALAAQRERDSAERKRAEESRLALLTAVAKPSAAADIEPSVVPLRRDTDGNLLVRGVRLPAEVAIRPAQPDVPMACAKLVGAWGRARFDGTRSAEVWVESMTRDCAATVVYARGGDSAHREAPTFERMEAVVRGGKLLLRLAIGASLLISQTPDQTLAVIWEGRSRDGSARRAELEMERMSSDPLANLENFALEERDDGVKPPRYVSDMNFSRLLPIEAPGAKTIRTAQLTQLLANNKATRLIDARESTFPATIGGALSLSSAGNTQNKFLENKMLEAAVLKLSGGDKSAPLVVFERSIAWGWAGYHAVLRLRDLGYTNIFWYRGGVDAWHDAGLPLVNRVKS